MFLKFIFMNIKSTIIVLRLQKGPMIFVDVGPRLPSSILESKSQKVVLATTKYH